MSFANKCTVVYRVWSGWNNDDDARRLRVQPNHEVGVVSVRTDRQNKSGQWDISNRAIRRALEEGNYIQWVSNIEIDGEDDGVLFVDDPDGYPLLQLEYERHHDIEEKPKGLFGEPGASEMSNAEHQGTRRHHRRRTKHDTQFVEWKDSSGHIRRTIGKPNPLSSLSTPEKVGIAAAGVTALGFIGYLIWKSQQSAAASLPVVQTPMPGTQPVIQPTPGTIDTTTGVSTGGQVYDPNLGGGGVMPVYSDVAPGNPASGSLIGV